jgi:hypothetical protein
MLSNIFKIYIKVIKNKKFTYYFALCTLLFITFILSNPHNEFVQGLRFLLDFQIMKLLVLLKIIVISYYNLPLGMLNILAFSILYTINVESLTPETFDNIPNLVDKNKILKYNKNFKKPKKIAETKKEVKEVKQDKSIEREEKEIKAPRRKALVASTDFFDEKKKNSKKEKDVEEVNLDETEDTIEKELKSRMSHEYRKLDEYDSSSSESSNSDSSDSSSDSSDSDKEIEEVSMNKAREHMLNSLRTSLKKRYLND